MSRLTSVIVKKGAFVTDHVVVTSMLKWHCTMYASFGATDRENIALFHWKKTPLTLPFDLRNMIKYLLNY